MENVGKGAKDWMRTLLAMVVNEQERILSQPC
jgi:hypothetical protein